MWPPGAGGGGVDEFRSVAARGGAEELLLLLLSRKIWRGGVIFTGKKLGVPGFRSRSSHEIIRGKTKICFKWTPPGGGAGETHNILAAFFAFPTITIIPQRQ